MAPLDVYVYNVLTMGLSLASDVFKQIIHKIISDLPGVLNIADDLLIFRQDDNDYDECFIRLLDHCREARSLVLTLYCNILIQPDHFLLKLIPVVLV